MGELTASAKATSIAYALSLAPLNLRTVYSASFAPDMRISLDSASLLSIYSVKLVVPKGAVTVAVSFLFFDASRPFIITSPERDTFSFIVFSTSLLKASLTIIDTMPSVSK